ncbi:transmembrane protein 138-like [Clavelina lepadiformis]|uniref:Transmembrane protein 138 n=1 Tax=Clavelina lepadiformis TaxID=159417 RepID=A0ABP0GR81_CLALP
MEIVNYFLILSLQVMLLVYDIIINALVDFINPANVIQLVLFILQDICLVFQLIVLFLELFNTTMSQAGFITVMIRKFRVTILVTIAYLGICIALHVWTLTLRWDDTSFFLWGIPGYSVFYIIQRGWSPFYYYYYKRTALRLGDSKFYGSLDGLRNRMSPH